MSRSGRRPSRARRLVVALVVLVGLLVAADRIGLLLAERAAATTIQRSQQLDERPSVSIGGFPFLTQLIAGDFHTVTVKARTVPAGSGERALRISGVTVVLHGVHVARDLSSVRADTANASGTIRYADLSRAVGTTISYAGTADGVGRVRATPSVTVAGHRITGTVTAGLRLQDSSLVFDNPSVTLGDGTPSRAAPQLQLAFGAPLPLTGLPFQITVHRVQAGPAGIDVALSGADLVYRR